jgi:hypothetical protein
MTISRKLLCATIALSLAAPAADARDAKETARVMKGLALQSGNERVMEAMRVLEAEGFLDRVGDALSEDGAASAIARPVTAVEEKVAAPAAPTTATAGAIDEARAVELAFAGAEPTMSKALGGKVAIGQKWVKRTKRSGRDIFEVKIMPESLGIVCFFTTYTIDVDAATGKVTRVK